MGGAPSWVNSSIEFNYKQLVKSERNAKDAIVFMATMMAEKDYQRYESRLYDKQDKDEYIKEHVERFFEDYENELNIIYDPIKNQVL